MLQVGRIFGSRGSTASCCVRLVESFLGREGCELAKEKGKTGKWGDGDIRLVARGRQVHGDVGANLVGARGGSETAWRGDHAWLLMWKTGAVNPGRASCETIACWCKLHEVDCWGAIEGIGALGKLHGH